MLALLARTVEDDDLGALLGEVFYHRGTEDAGRAGDDDDLAVDAEEIFHFRMVF